MGQVLYPLDHLPHYTLTSPTLTGLLFNGSSINGSLIKVLWKLLFSSFYIYLLCVCVCAQYKCGDQRTSFRSWFFPSTVWSLGLNSGLSHLSQLVTLTSIFKISLQNNRFPSGVLTPSSFLLILTPHTHSLSLPHPPLCLSGLSIINPSTLLYYFSYSSPLETLSFP